MAERMMTDAEYAERKGELCPFCGGNEVPPAQTGFEAVYPAGVARDMECGVCESYWREVYALVGYVPKDPIQQIERVLEQTQ